MEIHKTLIDVIQINILFLSPNKLSIFALSIKHIIPFKDRKLHLNGFRLFVSLFLSVVCVSDIVNMWMESGDSFILEGKAISNATYIHNALAFRDALRVQAQEDHSICLC